MKDGYQCFIYSPDHPADGPAFILPTPLPQPPRLAKPLPSPLEQTPPPPSLKRGLPDDDTAASGSSAKRPRTNGPASAPAVNMASPSKKRRLEEDGLLLLEKADDKMEDEVIEID